MTQRHLTQPPGLLSRVVRAPGSERVHVVETPAGQFVTGSFLNTPYLGVAVPVATRCGSVLRDSAKHPVVCMEAGTRVTCPRCHRITSIGRAAATNTDDPRGLPDD